MLRPLINWSCQLLRLPRLDDLEAQLKTQRLQIEQMSEIQQATFRVISKIRASLDLETIFRTTTKETCKLLQVERVAVYRFNEDWGGEFVSDFEFAESTWKAEDALGKNTVWNDSYLQEHQGGRYRQNESLAVADIYQAGLSQCHLDVLEQFYIRAYATAPIFVRDKLWGILAAYQHSVPHDWKTVEIQFLAQVATHLGFAVQQAELLTQVQEKANSLEAITQQQEVLFNVVAEIRESLDLDTLFKTTTKEVRKVLNTDRVVIFRFEPDSGYNCGQFIAESVLPAYDSILTEKIQDHCFGDRFAPLYLKQRMQITNNVHQADLKPCHLALLESFEVEAQIVVPLIKGSTLWGLLCIHHCRSPREWKTLEIQFIRQIAAQFNVALEHLELLTQTRSQADQLIETLNALEIAHHKVERLARLDGLTNVPNRRYFDETLDKEWLRLTRERGYLSLIMFDVDYFKPYNDHYGHPAGDQCLRQVAEAAQQVLGRSSDLLARYGGEEFAIILPNTDANGAIDIAQKIQVAIAALAIPHAKTGTTQPFITISLGIASAIPTLETIPQHLIARADKCLYEAKAQGRDRWVCEDGGLGLDPNPLLKS
ncbi:MAG: diguanylate cyclase [Snowella sp.]|nr:diguanylate cyclase [Snowella sp.]